LLHRQLGDLGSLNDLIDVDGAAPECCVQIRTSSEGRPLPLPLEIQIYLAGGVRAQGRPRGRDFAVRCAIELQNGMIERNARLLLERRLRALPSPRSDRVCQSLR
jgi:hypothetical protein